MVPVRKLFPTFSQPMLPSVPLVLIFLCHGILSQECSDERAYSTAMTRLNAYVNNRTGTATVYCRLGE